MSTKHCTNNRVAAIVDGDNMTRGGQICVPQVGRVLGRIAMVSHGAPVTFAMQRRQAITYMTAYTGFGWGIHVASMAPDAADADLMDAAADHIAHGASDLIVASGDHAFTELAGQAQLHVLAYRHHLSRRLRLAATTVTYLDDLFTHAVCGPWCGVDAQQGMAS